MFHFIKCLKIQLVDQVQTLLALWDIWIEGKNRGMRQPTISTILSTFHKCFEPSAIVCCPVTKQTWWNKKGFRWHAQSMFASKIKLRRLIDHWLAIFSIYKKWMKHNKKLGFEQATNVCCPIQSRHGET